MIRASSASVRLSSFATLWMITGLLLLGGIAGRVVPQYQRKLHLKQNLETLESRIASYTVLETEVPLAQQLEMKKAYVKQLEAEWEDQITRMQHFRTQTMKEIVSRALEGRIDFKIALFEARRRLQDLSDTHPTQLPANLGIPDTIGSREQADIRLGQLAATLRVLETCVRLEIPRVHYVQALPSRVLSTNRSNIPGVVLYPVSISFQCDFDQLAGLLEEMETLPEFVFLNHIHLKSGFPETPGLIDVHAVWSSAGLSASGGTFTQAEPATMPNGLPEIPPIESLDIREEAF